MTSAAFLYAPPPTCYSWKIAAVLCPHNTLVSSPQHIPGVEAKGVSGLILSGVYTSSASSPCQEVPDSGIKLRIRWALHILAKENLLSHPTLNPRITQRPGTRDGLSGHPQFHAEHSTVFWTLCTNGQISRPEGTQRFPASISSSSGYFNT